MTRIDRKAQARLKYRAKVAQSTPFWPRRFGIYDPFGKLQKACDEWVQRRKERNEARDKQLAILRPESK